MRLISLPRISKIWTATIIVALILVGVITVVLFPSPQDTTVASIVLLGDESTDLQDTNKEPQVKEEAPKKVKEIGIITNPENSVNTVNTVNIDQPETISSAPSPENEVIKSNLAEADVAPKDPLVLGKSSLEKTEVIPIDEDVIEQDAEEEPPKILPYARPECLEEKGKGKLLPIVSPQGLRPFDVYQSTVIPDLDKTPLTLVFSELGANPKVFELLKASFPKNVTCAFIANSDLSQRFNNEARELGYETLLMLPMEPMTYPKSDPGPSTLLTSLPKAENLRRFEKNLSQFTGYIGVTPYMGSRFARVKRDFVPLLKEVERRGLFYFEPRLIRSIALQFKPEKMLWAKGQYDIERGLSRSKIQAVLRRAEEELLKKKPVIITIQGDRVSFEEVKKWLPSILKEGVVLMPLSSVTQ